MVLSSAFQNRIFPAHHTVYCKNVKNSAITIFLNFTLWWQIPPSHSLETLQNLPYFWNTKTHIYVLRYFFRFSFGAALFFLLVNALNYIAHFPPISEHCVRAPRKSWCFNSSSRPVLCTFMMGIRVETVTL